MKLVVIESPYAGQIARNVEYARACMADSLRRGEAPIASHLLYTQPGILRDEVEGERELGINAGKVVANQSEPVEAVLRYVEKHPTDLIVLATSRRGSHVSWLSKSVSAPVTRKAGQMTFSRS